MLQAPAFNVRTQVFYDETAITIPCLRELINEAYEISDTLEDEDK